MNTSIHIGAILVSIGLSIYCFTTLSNAWLGYAFIAVLIFWLAWTLDAIQFDVEDLNTRKDREEERKERRRKVTTDIPARDEE